MLDSFPSPKLENENTKIVQEIKKCKRKKPSSKFKLEQREKLAVYPCKESERRVLAAVLTTKSAEFRGIVIAKGGAEG